MRKVIIRLTFLLVVVISSCKKDEADWEWCTDCQQETIIGNYEGTASYLFFFGSDRFDRRDNIDAILTLSANSSGLQEATRVINLFYSSISGIYDSGYYIQLAGNQQSFSAIIWRKENQIKLVGTVKKTDSEGEIREVLDFEVIRVE
jgi:hypothetical protein